MKKTLILLFLFISIMLKATLPLAQKGTPCAEIITGNAPSATLKFAAKELQHWIKEISGAKLSILSKPGNAEYKIFLKINPVNFPEDVAKLKGNDGYAVRCKDNNLYLIGSRSKGILNGVFRMLFKNTDIIWARPNTKFGTVFTKNPNLILEKVNYIDIPVYKRRGWQFDRIKWGVPEVTSEVWGIRQCTNADSILAGNPLKEKFGSQKLWGFGHNIIGQYILPGKYFNKHPDFYPLKAGKRIKPGRYPFPQLCFTNQKLVKAMAFEVCKKIKSNPGYLSYDIGIEDTEILCECPNCLKPLKLANGKELKPGDKAFRSTQFFIFLNAVTKLVNEKYPDARFKAYAYLFSETAPECTINKSIDISFAPVYHDMKHPLDSSVNSRSRNSLLKWLKLTKNIMLREYYGLVPACPRPADTIAISDWRFCNQRGMTMSLSQIASDYRKGVFIWDANAVYFWVMVNAVWNPYQDINTLRMEFFKRVFGPGAEDVRNYYAILEKQWNQSSGSSNFQDSAVTCWLRCLTSKKVIASCRNALEQASQKVVNTNGKKILQKIRANFENGVKSSKSSKISAMRVNAKPVFISTFDNGDWSQAPVMEQFFQQYYSNPIGKLHPDKTALRLLYDNHNLYIGVRCFSSNPEKMYVRPRSNPPKKNVYPDGEGFEVFLGGFFVGYPKYAQIAFDPNKNMGVSGRKVNYKLETAFNPDGWSAMLTIPWRGLGINTKRDKSFKALFIRWYDRLNNDKWSGYGAYLLSGKRHDPKTFIQVKLE